MSLVLADVPELLRWQRIPRVTHDPRVSRRRTVHNVLMETAVGTGVEDRLFRERSR